MPSDLETLIRVVLTEQAERAPHRATVLAGLRWARGRRPHRRLAVVAACVAVGLAAIGVPIGLHLTTQPLLAGSQVLHVQQPDIPLPYRVTYLPAGYVASMRVATATDLAQVWEPAGQGEVGGVPHQSDSFVQLDIFSAAAGDLAQTLSASDAPKADISGVQGYVTDDTSESDTGATLTGTTATWVPRRGVTLELTVRDIPDSYDVALRVARSVVTGGIDVIAQPVSFGDLPAGYSDELEIQGTSPSRWTVSRTATGANHDLAITAIWSTAEPGLDDRTTATVQGQQGWYGTPTASPATKGVVVALDGHWLTVTMPPSTDLATLTRTANGVSVFPNVGFPWLGR
ncbi:MAG TPA: hypothetical protein VH333_24765 [Pseudonocardiaceae bacterium]|jgi:hypothetical protein|nr:hypothetical protein [Pseudonocardiaceae bacterium]